jgi:protein-disulfide isomerase
LFALAGAVALVLAAGLVAGSLATGGDESTAVVETVEGSAETAQLFQGIPQRGTALGRADAPVTLAEYGDLQCPYCAAWAFDALPVLVQDYVRTGKLRIEFRGLTFIGPDSDRGLRAALAAGEQGKLWNVVDLLYRNQGHENSGWLTDETLRRVAASVDGLDGERMLARSDAMTPGVQEAQAFADASGINGTPAFEVGPTGGRLVRVQVSSLDADALRPAIEAALEQ